MARWLMSLAILGAWLGSTATTQAQVPEGTYPAPNAQMRTPSSMEGIPQVPMSPPQKLLTSPAPVPGHSIPPSGNSTAVPAMPGPSSQPDPSHAEEIPIDLLIKGIPLEQEVMHGPPTETVPMHAPPVHEEGVPVPAQEIPALPYPPPPPRPSGHVYQPSEQCETPRTSPWHFTADYLLWWFRTQELPALVTSGDFSDAIPGALGQPTTQVVIGGRSLDDEGHSGIRFGVEYDLDSTNTYSLMGNFFLLEQQSGTQTAGGDGSVGSQVLSRPFFNPNFNQQDADPLIIPGVMRGQITVLTPSRLLGAEVNLLNRFYESKIYQCSLGVLAGARFLALDQQLLVREQLQDVPGVGATPLNFGLQDNFTTYNRFYGGQLGFAGDTRVGNFTLKVAGKVAFGYNNQVLSTRGQTQIFDALGNIVAQSGNRGLLVQPSNAGRFTNDEFSVVPEGTVNLVYDFNRYVQLGVGYTILYWTKVASPEQLIDQTVNIQPIQTLGQVGIARPSVNFNQFKEFWAQGLNVTLRVTW